MTTFPLYAPAAAALAPVTPPASADFVTRRIREIYGGSAHSVALSTTARGLSLRVTDEHSQVLPFPDSAPLDSIDELLDLCTMHFGPGISELGEPVSVQYVSLDDLFGAGPALPADPATRATSQADLPAIPVAISAEWISPVHTPNTAVGA